MNFSIGCAFTVEDMLMNFPYKKLQMTCEDSYNITNDYHRSVLVSKIFRESVKIVLEDIVNTGCVFWLPLNGSKKCNIHIQRIEGEDFKRGRKLGKWKDLDIFKTMFSGYQLSMFLLGNRTPRIKPIYLNKEYTEIITNNANKGFQYGDTKLDKNIKDYYEQIFNLFPTVSETDIKKILNYCWKSLYLHNSYGGDVILKTGKLWCYIGKLSRSSLIHFSNYRTKLIVKLKVLCRRKKIPWDGYYYFALSKKQFLKIQQQRNNLGRKRKKFEYGPIYMYRLLDECNLTEPYKQYIFRIPYKIYMNFKFFVRNLITDKAEFMYKRDPLKFKDVLVFENEYKIL